MTFNFGGGQNKSKSRFQEEALAAHIKANPNTKVTVLGIKETRIEKYVDGVKVYSIVPETGNMRLISVDEAS